jgi:hypothetical protein
MSNYLISISRGGIDQNEIIHDPDSKLKVKAIDLEAADFKPSKGEISYFVTAGHETFAFETQGYKKQRHLNILHMIAWYCVYLGLLEAQIHSSWPL